MAYKQWGTVPSVDADALRKVDLDDASNSYAETVGDGEATSIPITHNLGTLDVVISTYYVSNGEEVNCDKYKTDGNTVTLGFAEAPATNSIRCVVVGTAYGVGAPVPTESTSITDATAVGRALLTAADEEAGRDAINAERVSTVNVLDFGAVGDWSTGSQTGTDNSAAFAAALAAAGNMRKLYVPAGNYRLGSEMVVDVIGAQIEGESATTKLYIDHTDGPGIRIAHREVSIKNISIQCSTARSSAAYDNVNIGLLVEGPDSPSFSYTRTRLDHVDAIGHPSHGFVFTGHGYHSIYERLLSQSNKGHGFVLDGGEIMGRTNTNSPGICTMRHLWSLSNGGHGLLLGSPVATSLPFRILIDNFESVGNSSDPGVRLTTDEIWAFGENCEIRRSAFGADSYDADHYALRISGRNWQIVNNRYINVGRSITLSGDVLFGTTATGSRVETMRVIPAQPVGVLIESGCNNAHVYLTSTTNMTVPVQDNSLASDGNVVEVFPSQSTQTALSTTEDNYQWFLGKQSQRLQAAAGGTTITGLAHPSIGRRVRLMNVGSDHITLAHERASSSPENRIISSTGDDFALSAGNTAALEYDGVTERWRITAYASGLSTEVFTIISGSANTRGANTIQFLGEGGAADSAYTLASGAVGQVVTLVNGEADPATNHITVRAGTGTNAYDIGTDYRLDTSAKYVTLRFDGINWKPFDARVLGTPVSGTLTNCTGLPVSGIAASTSTAVGVGSIEVGHASDTTVSRVGAGQLAVEGNPLGTKVAVPASNAATGVPGQWAADASYIYHCTATNTWTRTAVTDTTFTT